MEENQPVGVGVVGTPDYPNLKEKLGDEAFAELLDLIMFMKASPEEQRRRLEAHNEDR